MPATVEINGYCSFTPGEEFSTVQGHVRFDFLSDSCDEFDAPAEYTPFLIEAEDGTSSLVYSDADGFYRLHLGDGTYTITPQVEFEPYFFILPTSMSVTVPDDIADPDVPLVQDWKRHDLALMPPTLLLIITRGILFRVVKSRLLMMTLLWIL